MKKIFSLLLTLFLLTTCLNFYGCKTKITEEEAVGVWLSRESVYLKAYDCDCERAMAILEGGIYTSNLKYAGKAIDGSMEVGTWSIDDNGNLRLQENGSLSWSTWEYDGTVLKCGDWIMEKYNKD